MRSTSLSRLLLVLFLKSTYAPIYKKGRLMRQPRNLLLFRKLPRCRECVSPPVWPRQLAEDFRDCKKQSLYSFLELQQCTSFFSPTILGHIFTKKLWFSGFQKTEIITFYKIRINAVIGCIVAEHIVCTDRSQGILQIQYKLP